VLLLLLNFELQDMKDFELQTCRATKGGAAAVFGAPLGLAPHCCRATVSGAAGLELKNEDHIHARNQANDQIYKYFELQDLMDVNYVI
jgi:hypothetical protein